MKKTKNLGQFFTPNEVVKLSLKLSLINEFNQKQKEKNFFKYLTRLKILEPSFGTGNFLFEIIEILFKYYSIFVKDEKVVLKYINNNLYGIEIDSSLYNTVIETLWKKYNYHFTNLHNKDFLKWNTDIRFNHIIGNPPYITFNSNYLTKEYKLFLKNNFKTVYKIYDIYGCFIEKSINLLSEHGKLNFILPITYLENESFGLLRRFLLNNTKIKNIIFVNRKIFGGIRFNLNVLIVEKNKKNIQNNKIKIYNYNNNKLDKINIIEKQNDILYNKKFNVYINKKTFNFIENIEKKSDKKIEDIFEIHEAIKTGDINNTVLKTKETNSYEVIKGNNIKKYYIEGVYGYLIYSKKQLKNPSKLEYFLKPKIFISKFLKNNEIYAAYTEKTVLSLHSNYVCNLKENISNKKYLLNLLGILNSRLFSRYYALKNPFYNDILKEIKINNLKKLSISTELLDNNLLYEKIHEILFCAKKRNKNKIKILSNEIDEIIKTYYL